MIRVAVVGARGVGARHVLALRKVPDVHVETIVASSPDTASTAARSLDAPHWSAAWQETVRGDGIDAVHICTPNHLHAPIAEAALAAGKHVVCEKPLASDATAARRLAEHSTTRPELVAVVSYQYRFAPLLQRLRDVVARGDLGEVHEIRGSYRQNWMLDAGASPWRRDPSQAGRHRVLLDIGTHLLDLMETVIGEPAVGLSGQEFRLSAAGTDDGAHLLVQFEGGTRGLASTSQVSAAHTHRLALAVDGGHGSAHWTLTDVETLEVCTLRETSRLQLDADAAHRRGGRYWRQTADPDSLLVPLFAAAYGRTSAPSFHDGARHLGLIADLEPVR